MVIITKTIQINVMVMVVIMVKYDIGFALISIKDYVRLVKDANLITIALIAISLDMVHISAERQSSKIMEIMPTNQNPMIRKVVGKDMKKSRCRMLKNK